MNRLSAWHPAVTALYFLSVLIIVMFAQNPVLTGLALCGGVLFFIKTQSGVHLRKELSVSLLLFFAVALTNPLFSHNGVTPLLFLNGNPVTLEAILYGVYLAVMLLAVVYWFKCFNHIMTTDKLLFLLGKISPKLSLLLSSALRFIPLLKTQAEKIRCSQKTMRLFASDTWTDRLKGTARVYSALITWSLENAIDTGASMKARGYGLKGRSHYALYTFKKTDAAALMVIAVLDAVILGVMAAGKLSFSFYPAITSVSMDAYMLSALLSFGVLCLMPYILEMKEGLQWRYYVSKI